MIKLKDIVEGYTPRRSDSMKTVFFSAVSALEDLADLFRKRGERVTANALERISQNIRNIITANKTYKKHKND
tara:strand:+ start:342 stop:560 length:219 start_codon:yes stop_codon:yes gene_type:complete